MVWQDSKVSYCLEIMLFILECHLLTISVLMICFH